MEKYFKEKTVELFLLTNPFCTQREARSWSKKMKQLVKGGSSLYIAGTAQHYQVYRTVTGEDRRTPMFISPYNENRTKTVTAYQYYSKLRLVTNYKDLKRSVSSITKLEA